MTNELTDTGKVDWEVDVLADEVFVPASAEPRTWPLPNGVPVLHTWTSRDSAGNPVVDAVAVVKRVSDDGHWVRLHTLMRRDGETELNGGATSEFVVDVFDAPVPAASHGE